MKRKLIKVTSQNEVYLVEPKKRSDRSDDTLYGNVVRTSIFINDYFSTDIRVIHTDSVITIEEVSKDESSFFEWMRSEIEVPFSRRIAGKYNLKNFKELNKD